MTLRSQTRQTGVHILDPFWGGTNNTNTFFIGVEANPYLYTLFEYITTEQTFPGGQEGEFWRVVTKDQKMDPKEATSGTVGERAQIVERARKYQHCKLHQHQCLLVHAAVVGGVSDSVPPPAAVDFYLGKGWLPNKVVSDVGSRFQWASAKSGSSSIAFW